MAPAGVTEVVQVVGVVPTPIETTVASSNITADEVNALPTSRQPWRIAELQPGLTDNTPNSGQVTINGAFAYDNIFLVDGVDINDNLFGTANSLFVTEAIQETQVLTSGISAEYGRFSGGVINVITKSGGNDFSGSYRLNMYKPSWTSVTPSSSAKAAWKSARGRPRRQPGPRDHARRPGRQGPPVVFLLGPDHAAGGDRHVQRDGHPLRHRRDGGPQPDQADRDARVGPHAVGQLPPQSPDAGTDSTFGFSVVPSTISTGRQTAGPVRHHLPRRAHERPSSPRCSIRRSGTGSAIQGGTSTDIFDSPILTRTQALGALQRAVLRRDGPRRTATTGSSRAMSHGSSPAARSARTASRPGSSASPRRPSPAATRRSATDWVFDARTTRLTSGRRPAGRRQSTS